MSIPSFLQGESIVRLLQGAAVGAIATAVVGFNWGGWVMGSTAEKQAKAASTSAVVAALAPVCVNNFMQAADAVTALDDFKAQSSFKQTGYVEKGGWATMPGSTKPAEGVAKGCALLLKDLDLNPT